MSLACLHEKEKKELLFKPNMTQASEYGATLILKVGVSENRLISG
jgi:hypothetical protein